MFYLWSPANATALGASFLLSNPCMEERNAGPMGKMILWACPRKTILSGPTFNQEFYRHFPVWEFCIIVRLSIPIPPCVWDLPLLSVGGILKTYVSGDPVVFMSWLFCLQALSTTRAFLVGMMDTFFWNGISHLPSFD